MKRVENVYAKLGRQIRALRKQAGMTQSELAEKADLSNNYIGQIERGEAKPTLEILDRIASALCVSISRIFHFPEDQPRTVPDMGHRLSRNLLRKDLRDAELVLRIAEQVAEYIATPSRRRS